MDEYIDTVISRGKAPAQTGENDVKPPRNHTVFRMGIYQLVITNLKSRAAAIRPGKEKDGK
jgi:hypothetical protein